MIRNALITFFCVSLSISYGGTNARSDNSAIIAMDMFLQRTMPDDPQCVELQLGRVAVQNKTWCTVVVGRKIAGKIQWAKQIAPGDYWYASKKNADDFCKGTR